MQFTNSCNNSILCAEVESNVLSPKSQPHKEQRDTNQEDSAENDPTNFSLQTLPADETVESSREHSATLTSLDIVVKRNSINGSVSSDVENEVDDASELGDSSPECLPQQLGYAYSPARNTVEKQSENYISVGQRISTISYVSSGYGSLKDNERFLTTEMIDIPLERHVDPGTGSATSLAKDMKDDNEVKTFVAM